MTGLICVTCGTQHADVTPPPSRCQICDDERQYVAAGGQRWTTLPELQASHRNAWLREEPDLLGIVTVPQFAIGQRALLITTPRGNVLWDCLSLIDDATVTLVRALGGLAAIAISHPHYYSSMVAWAHAFDCPIWLHEGDRGEVMRPDPAVAFWSGETQDLLPGLTLIHAPGHFDGAAVLHWAAGAGGRGALLSGDILQVAPDRAHVSFMRSYPNMIPLGAAQVNRIAQSVAPFAYDRIYGAFAKRGIDRDAKAAVARSVARYLRWIG